MRSARAGFPRGPHPVKSSDRIVGQNHRALQVIREAQKTGRMAAFHRRRTCGRSALRQKTRRRCRQFLVFAARLRRTGARKLTSALIASGSIDVLRCSIPLPRWSLNPNLTAKWAIVIWEWQARSCRRPSQASPGPSFRNPYLPDLSSNQIPRRSASCSGIPKPPPAARALKSIRRFGCGYPPASRAIQGWRRCHGQPHQGQGGKEQDRGAFPRSRIHIVLRRRNSKKGDLIDLGAAQRSSRSPVPGSATRRGALGQVERTPAVSAAMNHDIREEIDATLRKALGLTRPPPPIAHSFQRPS